MTDLFQELGATAPQTALLLSRFAWVAISAFVLVGLWTLWLCGTDTLRSMRRALMRRLSRARPSLRRVRVAQADDEIERAFLILCRLLKRNPRDYQASLAMWEVARDAGHPERAEEAMLAVIRHELESRDGNAALRHWLKLLETGYEIAIEPELLLKLAALLRAADQEPACAATLRKALDAAKSAGALTELARACIEFDRETAEEAAWRALGRADLGPTGREALLELLARLYPAEAARGELLLLEADAIQEARGESSGEAEAGPEPEAGPPEPAAEPEAWVDAALGPGPGEGERRARVLEALPLEFEATALRVEVIGVGKKRVRFSSLDAIAVAAVQGLAPGPVIVIDLLLNWTTMPEEPLRIVRLRSDRFEPHRFAPEASSPMEALRAFLRELSARADTTLIPDRRAALGQPFVAFAALGLYQSEVLRVGAVETGLAARPACGAEPGAPSVLQPPPPAAREPAPPESTW
jgi:hypothetical protein